MMKRNETSYEPKTLKAFYVLDVQGTQKVVKAVNDVDLEIRKTNLRHRGRKRLRKTTLLKALFNAIEPPLRLIGGKIYYCPGGGSRCHHAEPEEKRKLRMEYISYVPQGSMSVLNPVLKLKETYEDFISSHVSGQTREDAFELAAAYR
jgi:peptide/nickel transport system ATP-binding protein